MSNYFRKAIDKIFVFLFPDAVGEISATFRYKLLIVMLVLIMTSSAAFTMVFF